MGICVVFVLYSGLTFATAECQPQLFNGDGMITPQEIVYTSHMEQCWEGYGNYVPSSRVDLSNPHARHTRYHVIRNRYIPRVRYRGNVWTARSWGLWLPRQHRRSYKRPAPRLKSRTVIRRYNKRGKLRKRVVKRRYM